MYLKFNEVKTIYKLLKKVATTDKKELRELRLMIIKLGKEIEKQKQHEKYMKEHEKEIEKMFW